MTSFTNVESFLRKFRTKDRFSQAQHWLTQALVAKAPSSLQRTLTIDGAPLVTLTEYFRGQFSRVSLTKVTKLAIIFVYFRNQIVSLTSHKSCNGYI